MAHIEDRRDEGKGWRVRYRAPDHRERSKSFARKVDAERFLISVEASKLEGRWVDPQLCRIKFGELTARVNLRLPAVYVTRPTCVGICCRRSAECHSTRFAGARSTGIYRSSSSANLSQTRWYNLNASLCLQGSLR